MNVKKENSSSSYKSYFDRGYVRGSIVRVKMRNFLTYDDCDVFPGPKLNVVIGPNGTGKSALTHAICLACNGKTGDIARSNDLSKFIKQGKEGQDAFIEVEILDTRSMHVVRRILTGKKNSSEWLLNGTAASKKSVAAVMRELHIDVDNLCSFMPQDRVGQFSRYSAKEVLQETLKAIKADPDAPAPAAATARAGARDDIDDGDERAARTLYDEQVDLSGSETAKQDKKRERDGKERALEIVTTQLAHMTTEMDRLEQRAQLVKLKGYLEVKLIKARADALAVQYSEAEAALEAGQTELLAFQTSHGALQEEERACRKQAQFLERAGRELLAGEPVVRRVLQLRGQVDTQDEEVERLSTEIAHAVALRDKDEKLLARLGKELADLTAQLQDAQVAAQDVEPEVRSVRAQIDRNNERRDELEDLQRQANAAKQEEIQRLRGLDGELGGLKDRKELFKQRLAALASGPAADRTARDALAALEHINNNEARWREEGRLSAAPIYGPAAMHIVAQDPAIAVVLERAVPINKLLGFVVLNDRDGDFLRHELREVRRLRVDIYTMHNLRVDQVVPYSAAYLETGVHPELRIQYLSQQLQCPDVIRAYLYSFLQLHCFLWTRTNSNVSNQVFDRLCATGVNSAKLYVHDLREPGGGGGAAGGLRGRIFEHSARRSKYAPNNPPSTSSVQCFGRKLLAAGAVEETDARRRELEAQKAQAHERIQRIDAQARDYVATGEEIHQQGLILSKQLQALRDHAHLPAKLQKQVDLLQMKIADKKRALLDDQQRGDAKRQRYYADAVTKLLDLVRRCEEEISKHFQTNVKKQCYDIMKAALDGRWEDVKQRLAAFDKQLAEKKRALEKLKARKDAFITDLGRCEDELNAKAEEYGGEQEFVTNVYPEVLLLCPENDTFALEERRFAVIAQIKGIVDNPHLQARYNELLQDQARLQGELKVLISQYSNIEQQMQQRSERWLTTVSNVTKKLNLSFQACMEKLGFRGEIEMKAVGKMIDYELQLRVAFHQDAPLVDLSGTRHSGGERAVSTVMFLMALQDMTSAPFRVVDEINQGMDERNERLVMDRIVQTCCSSDRVARPQYFLVSPKLLQALQALNHDDVTVLLVWNGPGILQKWRFEWVLDAVRKRVRDSEGHEKDNEDVRQAAPRKPRPRSGLAVSEHKGAESEDEDEGPALKRRIVSAH